MHKYEPFDGPLGDLNQDFHDSYELLVQRTVEQLGHKGLPVMIMRGDHVVLLYEGQRIEADVVPDLYHKLKAVSHVPLGLYTLLIAHESGPLDQAMREGLEHKGQLIQQALGDLPQADLPSDFEAKQVMILRSCLQVIEDVIRAKRIDQQILESYTQVVAPLLMDNAALAAKVELDDLHTQVMAWREMMDEADWESLHVIVCAGHQSRFGEATQQYFRELLGERDSIGAEREERVIYAESLNDDAAVLALLARHIVDQRAATAFFRSRMHLQQDLLTSSAAKYLDELLDT